MCFSSSLAVLDALGQWLKTMFSGNLRCRQPLFREKPDISPKFVDELVDSNKASMKCSLVQNAKVSGQGSDIHNTCRGFLKQSKEIPPLCFLCKIDG